jgi:hypothetical protein
MKTFASCVLLLFVMATASAQTEQTGWEEFAPEGGGFSMLFPTQPVETITAKANYTMHSFATTAGRATYVVSYTDYQRIKLGPEAFLLANRDRFINHGERARGNRLHQRELRREYSLATVFDREKNVSDGVGRLQRRGPDA